MKINASMRSRSLGLKLILVGLLAFLLWIPAMLIYALVFERSTRADQVRTEIYQLSGGQQSISGPIIVVPATIDTDHKDRNGMNVTQTRNFAFTPKDLSIDANITASQRQRSIYDATIYDADIIMNGSFGALTPPRINDGEATLHWNKAMIVLKFSNDNALKGIRDTFGVEIAGKPVKIAFEPGIALISNEPGLATREASLSVPGVSMALPIDDPASGFDFKLTLPMSGGGALYFSPVGEETDVTMRANWPDPSFQGNYLPDTRQISDDGFEANWRIPYLARNLPRSFSADGGLHILDSGKTFGVDFVDAASPYKSVNRALKYALMFMGVVFLTFFLFEATTGARAHAAQYILLGLTQVVFYLLVLAFAEHIGFELAFAGTAIATVALSGAYAATVFHSTRRGIIASVAFSGAYALIYLLMKSEDYALLIGSVTAFAAIALTMYVTRHLDWYGERNKT